MTLLAEKLSGKRREVCLLMEEVMSLVCRIYGARDEATVQMMRVLREAVVVLTRGSDREVDLVERTLSDLKAELEAFKAVKN